MHPLVLSPTPMAACATRGGPGCTAATGLRQAMHQGPRAMHQGPRAMHQGPRAMHQGTRAMHQGTRAMHQGPRAMHQGCIEAVGCRSLQTVPRHFNPPQAAGRVWSGLVRGHPQQCTATHRPRSEHFCSNPTQTHTLTDSHTQAHALTRESRSGPRRGGRAGAMQVALASKSGRGVGSGRGAASGSKGKGSGEEGDSGGTTQRLVWGLYGVYMLWLLVLPYAPGEPAWDIQPGTVEEVRDLSLNFFFVLPLLNQAGIHTMEAPSLHPAAEALFNFVNAWSFMFGPLLQLDSRQRPQSSPPTRAAGIWSGQAFLTNVFLIPYMALRLQAPKDSTDTYGAKSTVTSGSGGFMAWLGNSLVGAAKPLGAVGGAVAALSLFWFCYGRPGEGYGDGVPARWAYFVEYISTNRLAYAFVVDIVLYSVFQAWLVSAVLRRKEAEGGGSVPGAVKAFGYVPCFGLAALLVAL